MKIFLIVSVVAILMSSFWVSGSGFPPKKDVEISKRGNEPLIHSDNKEQQIQNQFLAADSPFFDRLPEEVMLQLFQLLSSPLQHLLLVCCRWRQVIQTNLGLEMKELFRMPLLIEGHFETSGHRDLVLSIFMEAHYRKIVKRARKMHSKVVFPSRRLMQSCIQSELTKCRYMRVMVTALSSNPKLRLLRLLIIFVTCRWNLDNALQGPCGMMMMWRALCR